MNGKVFYFALSMFLLASTLEARVYDKQPSRHKMAKIIDENRRVSLKGNTRPEAQIAQYDRGKVSDTKVFQHLQLLLKRSPESEAALAERIEQLHDKESPNFQRWLTVEELRNNYGPSESDISDVSKWLQGHGFKLEGIQPNGMIVDFSGTARQIADTFDTEIHNLDVDGVQRISNISDYSIPEALSKVVSGVVSLNNFFPVPNNQTLPNYTFTDSTFQTKYGLVPADLARIYNVNPLFKLGITGKGQTIVLIENSKVYDENDFWTFRNRFGLSTYTSGSFSQIHPLPPSGPNNCTVPGVLGNGFALEATLDAQWASAAAPDAAIVLASCADSTTVFGGLIALQNLMNSNSPPSIVSISFGQCETRNGAASNAAYNSVYQQAAALGTSIFVSSGDSGTASCDQGKTAATNGITVNALASTPYNVAVGGTDFADKFLNVTSSYWNPNNDANYGSALSYIPEIPWNSTCASRHLSIYNGYSLDYGADSMCNGPFGQSNRLSKGAGGGGPSACSTGAPALGLIVGGTCQGYQKPAWQSALSNPDSGVRDLPDVSLFAANGAFGHYYILCYSNPSDGGKSCAGEPSTWSGAGGTSFGAPIWAGFQALINQYAGTKQGNPNPVYYGIASAQFGQTGDASCNSMRGNLVSNTCPFYDITLGDIRVPCTGSANCYLPSSTYGYSSVDSTSNFPAFEARTGWDYATGIGSTNATNLIKSFWGFVQTPQISSANATTFTVGQQSSFPVTTSGFPPSLPVTLFQAELFLPLGLIFSDNGNGTGSYYGTPAAGSGNAYVYNLFASDGLSVANQSISIVVREKPAITSSAKILFKTGESSEFVVQSFGYPRPSISIAPALPTGLTFTDNGNGTASIRGTPTANTQGSYQATLTSSNSVGVSTQSVEVIIYDAAAMTSLSKTAFIINQNNAFNITTSGFPKPTISTTTSLPAGISLVDNGDGSATLSGLPLQNSKGIYSLALAFDNQISPKTLVNFQLVIGEPLRISSPASASFPPNSSVDFTVTSTGFPTPILSTSSQLPSGLTFVDNGNATASIKGTLGSNSFGTYVIVVVSKNGYFPDVAQNLTLTVNEAPSFTSQSSAIFKVGQQNFVTIRSTGFPAPTIGLNSPLPGGLTFKDNGNNTATISGVALAGAGGNYGLTLTSTVPSFPQSTQNFTLTVNEAPLITSEANATFKSGELGSFLITTSGYPKPRISVSGLPPGISLRDNGDGTASISGNPLAANAGTYTANILAQSGVSPSSSQSLSLSVTKSSTTPVPDPNVTPVPPIAGTPGQKASSGCNATGSALNDTSLLLILFAIFISLSLRTLRKTARYRVMSERYQSTAVFGTAICMKDSLIPELERRNH